MNSLSDESLGPRWCYVERSPRLFPTRPVTRIGGGDVGRVPDDATASPTAHALLSGALTDVGESRRASAISSGAGLFGRRRHLCGGGFLYQLRARGGGRKVSHAYGNSKSTNLLAARPRISMIQQTSSAQSEHQAGSVKNKRMAHVTTWSVFCALLPSGRGWLLRVRRRGRAARAWHHRLTCRC